MTLLSYKIIQERWKAKQKNKLVKPIYNQNWNLNLL